MKIVIKKKLFVFCLPFLLAACGGANRQSREAAAGNTPTPIKAVRVSDSSVNSAEPSASAAPDKSIYLVWVEHGANKNADVYVQHFDGEGNAVGEKTRVNPLPEQATAWFGDAPTIKIGGDGRVYVGWTARVDDASKGSANNLYLSVSSDGGRSFAAPVKVNDDEKPAAHGMHSLAIGVDNRVYMAWLDERNVKIKERAQNFNDENNDSLMPGFQYVKIHHNSNQESETAKKSAPAAEDEAAEPNSEIFYAVSKDGGKTFAPNEKLAGDVCPCCKTNLLAAPDGRVFASWRQVLDGDFRHIAVASTNDGGANFSAPVIVSNDQWQINNCPVSGAPMTVGKNNSLEIAWFTAGKAGEPGLYQAESTDGGKTFSARKLAFGGAVTGTPVFLTNEHENFDLVWESGGRLFRGESNGSPRDFKEIGDGNLPSAVFAGEKLFVAFIRKTGENRTVWLAEI